MATVTEITSQAIADMIEYYKPAGGKISQMDTDLVQRGVNAMALGARGDGVADDTAKIQEAIDFVASAGGGKVLIPYSTYRTNGQLNLKSNVMLFSNGATLINDDETHPIIKCNAVSNVTIEGIRVAYKNPTIRQTTGAIHVTGCNSVSVKNNIVENSSGLGIFIMNSSEFTVTRNTVRNTLADGIHVTNGETPTDVSVGGVIESNIVSATADDGIAVVSYAQDPITRPNGPLLPCEYISIIANVVKDVTNARGITVIGKNITVMGNTITDIAGSSAINVMLDDTFKTMQPSKISIIGNVIGNGAGVASSTRHGIRIYKSKDVIVSGNIVGWAKGSEINIYGDSTTYSNNILVDGNIIDSLPTSQQYDANQRYGITTSYAKNVRITNNTVTNTYYSGMYISFTDKIKIRDNLLEEVNQSNTTRDLITVTTGSYADVSCNTLKQSTASFQHGINISTFTGINKRLDNVFDVTSSFIGSLENSTNTVLETKRQVQKGSFITSGTGSATNFAIPHNLGAAPNYFHVQPNSSDATNIKYVTADANNLNVFFTAAPPAGTNNISVKWKAEL